MFESVSLLYAIFWAAFGLVSYKIISRIFEYGRVSLLIRDIVIRCLVLIAAIVEDVSYMRTLKYKIMVENNIEEEEIEAIKSIDEKALHVWKTNTIATIINAFPKELKAVIDFSNWDEAMVRLDKLNKTRRK